MTRFLSDTRALPDTRRFALALIGVFAVAIPSLMTFASLITTDLFIVAEDDRIDEDVYVTSVAGKIEGVIDGDLVIFTGNLTISGTVTGSVTVFSSGSVVVEPGGTIQGSLRGGAVSVTVGGEIGGDLFITAPSVVIADTGVVGRDAMIFAGTGRIEGSVERDVRGRTMRLVVDGAVAGDLDVATQKLEIGPDAGIGGDVLYRSPVEAAISSEATVSGTVTRLSTQSNFVYGVILALANVVGFLGFLLVGLAVLGLLRGSSVRATAAVVTRPFRSLLVGLLTVVALPLSIAVLALTLVGIPLAVLLVLVGLALFIVGPIPAVTALGNRLLLKRGGIFGAFLVGAVVWRLGIWAIPIVGGVVYLIGLVWGVGAWVLGAMATRRADPVPVALLPESLVADAVIPPDWEPPLAPRASSVPDAGDEVSCEMDDQSEVDDGINSFGDGVLLVSSDESGPKEPPPPNDDPDEGPSSSDPWGLPSG